MSVSKLRSLGTGSLALEDREMAFQFDSTRSHVPGHAQYEIGVAGLQPFLEPEPRWEEPLSTIRKTRFAVAHGAIDTITVGHEAIRKQCAVLRSQRPGNLARCASRALCRPSTAPRVFMSTFMSTPVGADRWHDDADAPGCWFFHRQTEQCIILKGMSSQTLSMRSRILPAFSAN